MVLEGQQDTHSLVKIVVGLFGRQVGIGAVEKRHAPYLPIVTQARMRIREDEQLHVYKPNDGLEDEDAVKN